MQDSIKLIGNVILERRTKDGEVIDREELKNLVVNAGKEVIAKLINGVSSQAFTAIGIGEGSTSPVVGDTALESEVEREVATKAYEASYKATFEKTFEFGSGVSYSITEAGVFDSAVASGSLMLDRFTFAVKAVDADTDLYVKVTITVA